MTDMTINQITDIEPTLGRMQQIKSTLFGSRKRKAMSLLLLLVLIPGTAYAAWTVFREAPGAGKFGSLTAPQVMAGTPTGDLYPGGTGSLVYSVTNDTGSPMKIVALEPANGGSGGAFESYVTVNTLSNLDIPVPVGASQITVPGAVSAAADTPNAAQNSSFSKSSRLTFAPGG